MTRHLDIWIKSYGQNRGAMQNEHSGSYVSTRTLYRSTHRRKNCLCVDTYELQVSSCVSFLNFVASI